MINKLLEYAKQAKIELEIYTTKNDEISIEYLNSDLTNYKTQDITEYNIKAIMDGATVKTTMLDISSPKEVIEILKLERTLLDETDNDFLAEPTNINLKKKLNLNINNQEIKKNIIKLNEEIKEKYSCVTSIKTEFNFECDSYELINTLGTILKDSNYHNYYSSYVVLNLNGKNSTCFEYVMAKELDIEMFKKKLTASIDNEIIKANNKSLKTNKYNIILSNKTTFRILNAIMPDFFAENTTKKQSVFANDLNEKIFSQKITIVEDPTNEELIGTRLFDTEGIKTYYKKIIDNGIFKTKLYNKKYAEKENVKSTGNSYGVRNVYITPGNKSFDKLIQGLSEGILITEVTGIHSGINHLTGNISLQCEGFYIKDGKKINGLKNMILSTNIKELFSNILEVGSDIEFFSKTGGAPSLLIENISIAGKEE